MVEASDRPRIHQYLGGAIRSEGGIALIANGTADHVHILARLRQDKAIFKNDWRTKGKFVRLDFALV